MTTTIETDLKEVLGEFKQEFVKLNRRLDEVNTTLTEIKINQAEMKGDIKVLDEKVTGIGKRLEKNLSRGVFLWGLFWHF
jgi:hypothetical protein